MEANKLIKELKKKLDDKKAENITVLDLKKLTSFTDFFIIATANSETHLSTLAKDIIKFLKKEHKLLPLAPLEDTDKRWILLDYHDIIIHLFLEETREYYDLEKLWFEAKKI